MAHDGGVLTTAVDISPAERFSTMSITSGGNCTLPNHSKPAAVKQTNRTDDIDGASPTRFMDRYAQRPNLFTTQDIVGAAPSSSQRFTNKPTFVCRNDDIDGSQSHPCTFRTTRVVNPLEPVYAVPAAKFTPPVTAKFVREAQLDASDIDGTKPSKYYKWDQRETHPADIEGAQAGWKPRHQRRAEEPRNTMDVSDILGGQFKTRRVTDTLKPTHYINGMTITDDAGSVPKALPAAVDAPFFPLETHDIEGARPGWKPKHEMGGIPMDTRRHFRNINFINDIEGAVANSRVTGLRTKRVTNPNERHYPLLDGAVPEAPRTPAEDQRRLVDPRDQQIQHLQAEVEVLRKEREIALLQSQIARLQGVQEAAAAPRLGTPGSVRVENIESQRMVLKSADGKLRVPLDDMGRTGTPAGRGYTPLGRQDSDRPQTNGLTRTGLLPASRGEPVRTADARPASGYQPTASRGGAPATPAVPASPAVATPSTKQAWDAGASFRTSASRGAGVPRPSASRREHRDRQADLDAVQALPDVPITTSLSRAGSASLGF